MTAYDVPSVIEVDMDGPVRVVRLNRPEQLNATNHELHKALADLFPQIDADTGARAVVLTGNGRAFSAGGDFDYLGALASDTTLRHETLEDGRRIVVNMVRCRVPVIAAVNGPAVGLGCSLVALSDIVFMAENAYLADPHVLLGLVAADGGPVTWPLLTSLQLAKEYALTGERIPARRAAGDRSGQSCLRRRGGFRPGSRLRSTNRRATSGGSGGHQAHPQSAARARRAVDTRLRARRGVPVVRLEGAPGEPRATPGVA